MKKNKKIDLNVWEHTYVRLSLKDSSVDIEMEDGSVITKPYHIDGIFVWWDKESDSIHMNTANDNPKAITMTIQRSMVALIEPLPYEEEVSSNESKSVN